MKIALIGCYPPPYGGISVHIKRMKIILDNKNIKNILFNDTVENKNCNIEKGKARDILVKLFFLKYKIIHFHSIDKKIRIIIPIYKFFGKKVILTVHGESLNDQILESNFIIRKLLIFSLKKIDKIICVNSKIVKDLKRVSIDPKRLINIPAYLNPVKNMSDYKIITNDIKKIVNGKDTFLIVANGWIRFYNNEDLYGIDLLIELINKLKIGNLKIKMIIALLGTDQQTKDEKIYYLKLKDKIKRYEIEDKVFIYEVKDTEFYPILENSNLFIRPTNTDGDALSIRESIYFKVPVIASDVIERPQGTVLFKNRNFEDLYNKVVYVIENYDKCKKEVEKIKVEDNSEKILKVYKEVLRGDSLCMEK